MSRASSSMAKIVLSVTLGMSVILKNRGGPDGRREFVHKDLLSDTSVVSTFILWENPCVGVDFGAECFVPFVLSVLYGLLVEFSFFQVGDDATLVALQSVRAYVVFR